MPLAVTSSTQGIGIATVILSGVAGGTSGPTVMHSQLILSLTRCAANDGGSVDRTVNVLQWAVGPNEGNTALYRGAVVGNLCLLIGLLGFHLLSTTVVWALTWKSQSTWRPTVYKSHFPGIHGGFLMMLLPGVVTGTAHLMFSPLASPTLDGCLITIGPAAVATFIVCLAYVLFTQITCLFVKCPAVVVQRAMEAYPRWHAVFGGTYMWIDDEDEHLSGYGALFEMYRRGGHREKFFLVEVSVALILAALDGLPVGCQGGVILGFVLTLLFLTAVIVYRPYLSRGDGWYTIGSAFLQAVSMLLILLSTTQQLAAYLLCATVYVSVMKVVVDVCHAYYRTVRTNLLKLFLRSSGLRLLHETFDGAVGDKRSSESCTEGRLHLPRRQTIAFHPAMPEEDDLANLLSPIDDVDNDPVTDGPLDLLGGGEIFSRHLKAKVRIEC